MIVVGAPVLHRYDLLRRFLDAIEQGDTKPDRVLVVDNGTVCPAWPGIEVLRPGKNVGVAAAWNLLADAAMDADCLIIANDDLVPPPDAVGKLAAALGTSQDPIVCSMFMAFFAQKPGEFRKRVGCYDENFWPIYYEDTDMMWRLRLRGIQPGQVHIPMEHFGSASFLTAPPPTRKFMERRIERNRSFYLRKWGGLPGHECYRSEFNGKPPAGWHERPVTKGGLIQPADRGRRGRR